MSIIVETHYFGNLTQVDKPRVLIIPAPYEYTTGFIKGVKNASQAILNSSLNLDLFDEELWADISRVGINTSDFVDCAFVCNGSKQPFIELEQVVKTSVINGSIPVVVGGESTISLGSVKAVYDLYPDVTILHFGSRPKLKQEVQENKYHHQCSIRNIIEEMPDIKLVQIGARSISEEESIWINENPRCEIFFAREKQNSNLIEEVLASLSKNVYISFDFSVLDPSIMPSSLSPEPGGLLFDEVLNILRNVCTSKEIIGCDFVNLAPREDLFASNYLASKLIYKTIGYMFAEELGVFEEEQEDEEDEFVTS